MDVKPIPFNKPFIAGKELYNIAQAVLKGHLAGDGHYTRLCHRWLEERLGCRKALLTHSCTAALEMAALLAGIGPGDEVIVPSFTFVSTANAFVLRGGVPVFIDIRPDTLNMDETLIEEALTERTRVIVPVHYAGVPCAMDEIMDIARRRDLLVVEDAAQALLTRYHSQCLGTVGHLGCLSFHETKNIISGEGGALLVNDERFVQRAEIIREKGTDRSRFFRGEIDKYSWVDIGSSFLPSELIGAFLYAQMEQAEEIIGRRIRLAERYHEGLRPLEEKGALRLPPMENEYAGNGHIFYVVTASLDERTRLVAHLKKSGILAVFHYVPLHSSPAGRRFGRVGGTMAVTDDLSERLLRLPMYYEMTEAEQQKVVQEVFAFYSV
ncbi:MAG TPA: dTDP-4-amino-4,6-dideoxygalactose transaminase [Deltaproteobacteria bacterium]|nr:dTDP-4-amino-4,6-dideoxygalactose transaminase [Deltaproteobacteria bacterium]HQI82396.1 dTDP-4-amino-4,6-dideoxygalactose transaminase [Deltaproteobacteria bacterium]